MRVETCKGVDCGAQFVWASTVAGVSMPLDVDPVEDGNVEARRGDLGLVVVEVHPVGQSFIPTPGCDRYVAHFATCPNSDEFRGRR